MTHESYPPTERAPEAPPPTPVPVHFFSPGGTGADAATRGRTGAARSAGKRGSAVTKGRAARKSGAPARKGATAARRKPGKKMPAGQQKSQRKEPATGKGRFKTQEETGGVRRKEDKVAGRKPSTTPKKNIRGAAAKRSRRATPKVATGRPARAGTRAGAKASGTSRARTPSARKGVPPSRKPGPRSRRAG